MREINYEFFVEKLNKNYKFEVYAYHIGAFNYNWHDHVELLTVVNGALEASIDGVIYNLFKDDICFIDSSIGHATLSKDKNTIAIVLHFEPRFLKEYIPKNTKVHFETPIVDKNDQVQVGIRRSMAMLVDSFNDDNLFCDIKRKAALYNIMYLALNNYASIEPNDEILELESSENEVVKKIITYLKDNYKNRIYLNELADLVGYHPNYTSEIFSKIVGMPFTEFLQRYRLSRATKNLKNSDERISDIALNNGFSNVRAFNSYFKETFKRTPSEYRKSLDKETKDIDAEFKKIFLGVDSIYWQSAKSRWISGEKNEKKFDVDKIKMEAKKEVIDEIINSLKKLK